MEYLKDHEDLSTSTERALSEIDPDWRDLPGVIVFGSHQFTRIEEKMELIRKAREEKIPFFGECAGLQLAAIEYARNVLNLQDANSEEIDPNCKHKIIYRLPKLVVGIRKADGRMESFWNHYAVNPAYWHMFYNGKLIEENRDEPIHNWSLSTQDDLLVSMHLSSNSHFFMGTQYHPSYNSSKDNPHPVLVDFINACKKHRSKNLLPDGAVARVPRGNS